MRYGSSRTRAASSARLTTRLRPLTTVQKESRPYKMTDIQTTECTINAEDATRDNRRKFPKYSDRVTRFTHSDMQTGWRTCRQNHTRDVKSGGCTDNAERTTQDMLRRNHEIGQSPSTPQSIICNLHIHRTDNMVPRNGKIRKCAYLPP